MIDSNSSDRSEGPIAGVKADDGIGKCRIVFQPWGQEVVVSEGTDLLAAAIAAGIQISNNCGGEGICGECRVIVRGGDVATAPTDWLTEEERKAGYVLACRTAARGDVLVEVPAESRVEGGRILTEGGRDGRPVGTLGGPEEVKVGIKPEARALFAPSPLTRKLFLRMPAPTLHDNISDLDRLHREVRRHGGDPQVRMDLADIRHLGRLLRRGGWQVTVTLGQRDGAAEALQIEPGDTSRRNYGIALDVGTTTRAIP